MNAAIRTAVKTHLEAVCGVQRSSQIWYVWKTGREKESETSLNFSLWRSRKHMVDGRLEKHAHVVLFAFGAPLQLL